MGLSRELHPNQNYYRSELTSFQGLTDQQILEKDQIEKENRKKVESL